MPDEGPGPGAPLVTESDAGALPAKPRRAASVNVLSWEVGRLRQSLPLLVRRCMGFSAMPRFDDALVGAVKDFYGLEMDVTTAEAEILEDSDERIRFFPWFLWDWRTAPGAPTIGERFLVEEEHDEHERRLLEGLCQSYIGFYEALEDATDAGARVRDVGTSQVLRIDDDGLAGELYRGQILQARLVRVRASDGPCVLLDAVYAVLPPDALATVQAEVDSLPGELGGLAAAFKAYAGELLEVAEHLLETLARPPLPTNADGERLLLCRSVVRGADAEAVRAMLACDPDAFWSCAEGLWGWRAEGRSRGYVRAVGSDRVELGATSQGWLGALEAALVRLAGVTPPRMRSLCDFSTAVEGWARAGGGEVWLRTLPDVVEATRSWLLGQARRLGDGGRPLPTEDPTRRVALVARLGALADRVQSLAHDRADVLRDLAAVRRELGLG